MTECTTLVPLSSFNSLLSPPIDSIIPIIVSNGVGGYVNYKTTLSSVAEALPPQFNTFTGSPLSFTPTKTNILYVRTDVSPNLLYRSTGTTQGSLSNVGGIGAATSAGGGIYFEYSLGVTSNSPASGQITASTQPNASASNIIRINYSPINTSSLIEYYSYNLSANSLLMLYGRTSGARGYYLLASSTFYANYAECRVNRLSFSSSFIDTETVELSIISSASPNINSNEITTSTTVSGYSEYVVDASSNNISIALPTLNYSSGYTYYGHREIVLTRVDTSSNLVSITCTEGFTDTRTSIKLPIYSQLKIRADHVNNKWHAFNYYSEVAPIAISSSTYSIKPYSQIYIFDCTSNNITATLPSASIYSARITIKLKDVPGGFGLTLNRTGTDLIDNSLTSIYLSGRESLVLQSDGINNWFIV